MTGLPTTLAITGGEKDEQNGSFQWKRAVVVFSRFLSENPDAGEIPLYPENG